MISLSSALNITMSKIDNIYFKFDSIAFPTAFSRSDCVLDFANTIYCILSNTSKPLQLHLDDFFDTALNVKGVNQSVTKQAFSEARLKLKHGAFVSLNSDLIGNAYTDGDYERFLNYRLLAIDGSDFDLPNTIELQQIFGVSRNYSDNIRVHAHASVIYDVVNDLIVESTLDCYRCNEKKQAKKLIESFADKSTSQDVYLLDRGYYAGYMLDFLNNHKYVMRLQSSCSSDLVKACLPDQTLIISADEKPLKVRVLNIELPTGETEKLVTNIFDESIDVECFKELYHKRWGIETKYNQLKNRLQIESFTGKKPEIIYQDFYAAIYLSNLLAIAKTEVDQLIKEDDEKFCRRHKNQTNMNYLIPKMIKILIECFLEEDHLKRIEKLRLIEQKIRKQYQPIRPGRHYKQGVKQHYHNCNFNYKTGL